MIRWWALPGRHAPQRPLREADRGGCRRGRATGPLLGCILGREQRETQLRASPYQRQLASPANHFRALLVGDVGLECPHDCERMHFQPLLDDAAIPEGT
jgi:hypothetical protein